MKVTGHNANSPTLTKELATDSSNSKSIDKTKGPADLSQLKDISKDKSVERSPQAFQSSQVDISDEARLMQKASEIAYSTEAVRSDRVAQLKKSISDGSYKVDSSILADRLLEEHLTTDFGKNSL